MADAIHRTIEENTYDGTTGAVTETRTVHQLGIEVDGVFVPFISKEGSYVDRLVEDGLKAQDAQAKQQADQQTAGTVS